jgi:hypothetical protein
MRRLLLTRVFSAFAIGSTGAVFVPVIRAFAEDNIEGFSKSNSFPPKSSEEYKITRIVEQSASHESDDVAAVYSNQTQSEAPQAAEEGQPPAIPEEIIQEARELAAADGDFYERFKCPACVAGLEGVPCFKEVCLALYIFHFDIL